MKPRIIIFLFGIACLLFLAYKFIGISSVVSPLSPQPEPTNGKTHTTTTTLTYHEIVYDYEYFIVHQLEKLSLISNFDTPVRASNLATKNRCDFAINGGFYSTDNRPLGVFIGNGYEQANALKSALFNGFFGFSSSKAVITKTFDSSYPYILQSGPLLLYNASPLPLAIQNDEHARRSAVVITNEGQIVFVTFFIRDSIYNGPLLGDLPTILHQFATNEGFVIEAALNLDGGSATYFKHTTVELPELSSIGSLFCIQN